MKKTKHNKAALSALIASAKRLKNYLESPACVVPGFDVPDSIWKPFADACDNTAATPNATPLSGTNGQLMIMAAHSYCLGRRTYIVGSCCEWLRTYWELVDKSTRGIIIRDTAHGIECNEAGADMDKREWQRFLEWAEQQEAK